MYMLSSNIFGNKEHAMEIGEISDSVPNIYPNV